MKRHRRTLLAALALSPLLARAQAPGGEGVTYTTLRKQLPVETPGKIEVVEFFWYGCIHCYHFEPLLAAWVPKLKSDTQFRRVPAVFDDPRFITTPESSMPSRRWASWRSCTGRCSTKSTSTACARTTGTRSSPGSARTAWTRRSSRRR